MFAGVLYIIIGVCEALRRSAGRLGVMAKKLGEGSQEVVSPTSSCNVSIAPTVSCIGVFTSFAYSVCAPYCTVDCEVNNWGSWNSCSNSCYQGIKQRYRRVYRSPNGGNSCPSLTDTNICNAGIRQCDIDGRCWNNNYVRASKCGVS